jgi:hypothetical protein
MAFWELRAVKCGNIGCSTAPELEVTPFGKSYHYRSHLHNLSCTGSGLVALCTDACSLHCKSSRELPLLQKARLRGKQWLV